VTDTEQPAQAVIDWGVAERVAAWTAARTKAPVSYQAAAMQADFDELTARAEGLVAESTGLKLSAGPTRGRVIDRAAWVHANVVSFQRLLGPTLSKLAERKNPSILAALPSWVENGAAGASRSMSGAQFGLVLGWMSTRVLGQYDILLAEADPALADPDQDVIYFVGPNVEALEKRFGFPPKEFRLWLALHEVTHRFQFTAVPWLGQYFHSLVDQGLEPLGADPRRMLDAVRRAADEVRAGRSPLQDAGMLGLVATPEQLEAVRRIQALMSLLEGHGDVTMDRAGAEAVPGAARFSAVLHARRQETRGPARLLQQLLGIEAKLRQYADGEKFVRSVEDAGGVRLFSRVWQGPEWLPSMAEIRDPSQWVTRVGGTAAIAG
jgi:coenzyme F420 biosynthesis associated uncharacterized protein